VLGSICDAGAPMQDAMPLAKAGAYLRGASDVPTEGRVSACSRPS